MRRAFTVALATALVALGGVQLAETLDRPGDSTAQLQEDLDQILAKPGLDGAHVSVAVQTADGETLYERDADSRLNPASNAKLFTSAAAFDILGPSYRFSTEVLTDGRRAGDTVDGNLYLKGNGDPTTLASDYDGLAKRLADSGIRSVTGDLVADDSFFDDVRLGVSWAWDDEPYYYSGQISALTVSPDTDYDAGTVIVNTSPTTPGQPAKIALQPKTDYVEIVNETTTTQSGDTTIWVEREHGSNRIVVSGTIAVGAEMDQQWATVWEPTGYAADVFHKALTKHGITIEGATTRGVTPERSIRLATHRSMPLSEMYVPFLKLSNNGHAEVLVKAMGQQVYGEGSWGAGIEAMLPALQKLGVDTDTIALVDGSGLSRMDYLPSREIAHLLAGAQDRPWFDTWYDALPIAGEPDRMVGGTLDDRMVDTAAAHNVHAKTGSLTGVTSLSGYVTAANGERLIFAVMQNYYVGDYDGKVTEDQIAIRLAEYGGGKTGVPEVSERRRVPLDVECSWVKAC